MTEMRWLDGTLTQWTYSEQIPGDGEGQRGLTCCSPWGRKESNKTGRLNNHIITDTWNLKGTTSE